MSTRDTPVANITASAPQEVQKNTAPSANTTAPAPPAKQPIISKNGIRLFGYTAPWWIVIIVVLLLVYLANDNGWFDGATGTTYSGQTSYGSTLPPVTTEFGPSTGGGLDTPAEITRIFGNSW